MNNFFKVVGGVFVILFIWAAALQSNDPDAFNWYLIYGVGALASLLFIVKQLKFTWALILFVFYTGFALYNLPTKFEGFTIGEGDITNIEKAREVGGLLILGLVMIVFAARVWYLKRLKI